jgi:hypothetical protein
MTPMAMRSLALAVGSVLLAASSGCGGDGDVASVEQRSAAGVCSPYVTGVIDVTYGTGAGFGQDNFPDVVYGPPHGGGTWTGSLDVLSLGNGGSIVVELGQVIVDGPGPDVIVFENPFDVGGDEAKPFAELASVELSADGSTFHAFACSSTTYPYGSCAGWHPVLANPATNALSPFDPAQAGGDAFDLGEIGLREARFVRIVDRADMPGDFDLDAVAVVNGRCR